MPCANYRAVALHIMLSGAYMLTACTMLAIAASASVAHSMRVTSADGTSIAYDVTGDGPTTIVFVHGWSCDRTYWDAQVSEFSVDYRVVRLDLAGHGASGAGRLDYSMASFGADVAAVVDALELERVLLVGHSMGGDVVMEAAKLLPGRVAGLVWVDTYKSLPVRRTEDELQAIIAPFRQDFRGTTEGRVRAMFPAGAKTELVTRVAGGMASAPPEIALSALESALRYAHEIPASLSILRIPVLAINPDDSPTDEASLRAHGVESIIIPGVGHFPMMEDPVRFNSVLREAIHRFASSEAS
jgi:pimeloyl-ACP methyl ester carboxylesterase